MNVYVDGYNLYHGCFSNKDKPEWRQFRWLDLARFSAAILENMGANADCNRIRYFTSRAVSIKNDPDITPETITRQDIYWRALGTIANLTIHKGMFTAHAKQRYLADPAGHPSRPRFATPHRTVRVVLREEKGSDVNLAAYLLLDAFKDDYDVAVVVTNDSDLAEPIALVRRELGKKVAIVNPRASYTAVGLRNTADEYYEVRRWMLEESQFPERLSDGNGVISKPSTW